MLALLNTYPIIVSQGFIFQSKQGSLQSRANLIATALSGLETVTADGVMRIMSMIIEDMGTDRIIVTDEQGIIAFDNSTENNALGTVADMHEIGFGLAGNDIFRSVYSDGAFLSSACVPVMVRSVIIGTVYISDRDTEQAELLEGIQSNIARISLFVSILVIIISVIFSKVLSDRISSLLHAMKTVREGKYSHRVQIKGNDEIAQLAAQFNDLTDRLQTTDEVRRRFVSDASHELKTPLASIRLLADSIKNTEDIQGEVMLDFVSDISGEVDRLSRVTEELLSLTRLDAGAVNTEMSPVNIKNIVLRVERMLRPVSAHFGVELRCELQDGCVVMAADDGMYQIIFNIVENAIKYTQQGGCVRVELNEENKRAVLIISDTGIGIPEEDISRIFERFYRVDKARSRLAGGTGLGLAIVYSGVRAFGGEINVESTLGKGTCFTLSFPIAEL